jgi:ribonuclease T2
MAGTFDYYLLSLSIAPSFCALSPRNQAKAECRNLSDTAFRRTPLTVHGLWPNLARVSVNRQPQDCPGPELDALPSDLQAQLQRFMPGGPGLARHEWERHGTCSDLSPETYFGDLVRLAQSADTSVGTLLRDDAMLGRTVRIDDLLTRVAVRDPGLARAIVVSCSFPRGGTGDRAALIDEIRVVLSKGLAPMPAGSVGLGQNSGCPGGAGFLPG